MSDTLTGAGDKPVMDVGKVLAIDIHTHAEVSCHDHEDPIMGKFFDAASVYFKADRKRPTIPETIAYYRAQNIAFVMFTETTRVTPRPAGKERTVSATLSHTIAAVAP